MKRKKKKFPTNLNCTEHHFPFASAVCRGNKGFRAVTRDSHERLLHCGVYRIAGQIDGSVGLDTREIVPPSASLTPLSSPRWHSLPLHIQNQFSINLCGVSTLYLSCRKMLNAGRPPRTLSWWISPGHRLILGLVRVQQEVFLNLMIHSKAKH